MRKLGGIIIPAVTPFDKNGELLLDSLKANFEVWNKTDVSGIMCLGSNGEFRMLSDDESFAVIATAAECADPSKTLIAGVGRESLYQTLAFIRRVEEANLKVDYFSILTPHYFKGLMTDKALIDYFTRIADASSVPILLYCAPPFANDVTISADVVRVLADHPNIHGIKDTSKNMMNAYMDAVGGRSDFEVLSGSMSTIFACMDRGGKGGVVSASNYFPQECANVVSIYMSEGHDAAWAYYEGLRDLISKTGARGSVAAVKATMNLLGMCGGYPRRPIQPLEAQVCDEIADALRSAGKIAD